MAPSASDHPTVAFFKFAACGEFGFFGRTVRRIKSKGKSKGKKAYEGKPAPRAPGRGSKQQKHVKAPYPHFRYYKKSGHPALIEGEYSEDEYSYRKVMHGERDGKKKNEKVSPNPNRKDPNPMYIGKRKRHDKMASFEDLPLPWKYPGKK